MKKLLLLAILLAQLTTAYSQNIYSALHHDRNEDFHDKVPASVVEENTFYLSSSKEVSKNKKKLNAKKKVLIEERFGEDGKLEARLTYTYDTSGFHSLTRKLERWTSRGVSSETAFYEYDSNWFLIKVTDKTDNGNIHQETILSNNEKGNPIELKLFDGRGNAYGTETAVYDYSSNKAYTRILNNQGATLSGDTLIIDFTINLDSSNRYNDKGDLIQTVKSFYEYEYDEFGNWTTMKIFRNLNGKRKNDRVFKRKMKYPD